MVVFFFGNLLMFIFGVVGVVVLGMVDIFDVMIVQGLLLFVIVVFGLNIWIINDNVFYVLGLGFVNIIGMLSKMFLVINGIIGMVCVLWLYNNFVGWLIFFLVVIFLVGGVIIVDYLMNCCCYEYFVIMCMMSVNWVVILVVVLGIVVGYWLLGIVLVNVVLGGVLSYLIFNLILNCKMIVVMMYVEVNSVE